MTPYLLAFVLPLGTMAFLVTAPHPWYGAIPVFLVAALFIGLDRTGTARPRPQPRRVTFDLILVGLALLHVANLVAFLFAIRRELAATDLVLAIGMMGTATGYSAIVVGHELIHRRGIGWRAIGRALLWTGFYDHFYVEHLRGHHVRAGTGDDPATARFDEPFWTFARRNIPGEIASAWQITPAQVAFGIAVELALMIGIFLAFGSAGLAGFVLQAAWTWMLITAVNYFEHWGANRMNRRIRAGDAWDCDSAVTQYSLLAVARHPDHHLHAGRSYSELHLTEASPKLPHGYLRMVLLVVFHNRRARRLLAKELKRAMA
jgi:alkane 1-monooxygenase